MPAKLEKCVKKIMAKGKSEKSAYAICNAQMKDKLGISFTDRGIYDGESRTLISVRDGVQRYLGAELGISPPDKYFYIYRAPETIAQFAGEMSGLPITDDHVSMDQPPAEVIGKVLDATIIDVVEPRTNTTVKVSNRVEMNGELPENRELSLGYLADLIKCELYDFEQVDIVPHHLAIVEKGRCGEMCTFTDKENDEMKKKYYIKTVFLDAETGEVNMQQVLQLVNDLPDAIKGMPLKALQKLVPALQAAVAMGKTEIVAEGGEAPPAEGEGERSVTTQVEDEPPTEEEKKAMADAEAKKFSDAVTEAADKLQKTYAAVVSKAKDFLPDTYDFADKSSKQIMKDAVATQHTETFEDSELSTAFKLLKQTKDYRKFGDSETPGLVETIGDKKL